MTVSILQTKDPAINAVDVALRERYVKLWKAYQTQCARRRKGVNDEKLNRQIRAAYDEARVVQELFDEAVRGERGRLGIPEDPDPDAVFVPAQSGAKRKKKAA
jgi:hypothetical protein